MVQDLVDPRVVVADAEIAGLDLELLLASLRAEGIAIDELALQEADLEDVFLKIMGGDARAPALAADN